MGSRAGPPTGAPYRQCLDKRLLPCLVCCALCFRHRPRHTVWCKGILIGLSTPPGLQQKGTHPGRNATPFLGSSPPGLFGVWWGGGGGSNGRGCKPKGIALQDLPGCLSNTVRGQPGPVMRALRPFQALSTLPVFVMLLNTQLFRQCAAKSGGLWRSQCGIIPGFLVIVGFRTRWADFL